MITKFVNFLSMKIISLDRISIKLLLISFFFFGGLEISLAQCPILVNTNQSFCDVQNAKVSDLMATANGNGVRWYPTANSTIPLSNTTELLNGTDYYVDDNSGSSCVPRQSVRVSIFSSPTGQSFQGVCVSNANNATIANLIANGNGIKWYSVSVGGSALASSTVLANNTIYYASQTNPNSGCESSRLSVFVNVQVILPPTGDRDQFFCKDVSNPPSISDLDASGNNNWYSTMNSPTPLSLGTSLVNGQSYFASTVAPPCESEDRLEVIAHLLEPNKAGSSTPVKICSSEISTTAPIDLFSKLGGIPDATGVWTGPLSTTNGNQGTLDVSTLTVDGSPYVFTYTVSTSSVCPPAKATISIDVIPSPDAGSGGSLSVCSDSPSQNLFLSLGGSPETGGSWSPALTSGTGFFDPKIDAAGIYTYTVSGVFPCPDARATVNVVVSQVPKAGVDANLKICSNGFPQDLFVLLGNTAQSGGFWSPAMASGSGIYNPSVDPAGIYTYTVMGIAPCANDSASINVSKIIAPNAGISETINLCYNAASLDLFGSLGGTPESGGSWSPALASGSGVFDINSDAPGSYIYTVKGVSPCLDATAAVSIVIVPISDAGTSGKAEFCSNSNPSDLILSLGGSPQSGGVWSPALASGSGVFNPSIDIAGIYTYTIAESLPCNPAPKSSTVSVKINPVPDAGISGTLFFCSNALPSDLFLSLGGSPQMGGVWSPRLVSGTGIFNPKTDSAGNYTYTVGGILCASASATVNVSVGSSPNAGGEGATLLIKTCETTASVDLFSGLNGTQDSGIWEDTDATSALNNSIFNPSLVGPGTYHFTYTASGGVAPCLTDSAVVSVVVSPTPNAGTFVGIPIVCSNLGTFDLFSLLNGNQSGGIWTNASHQTVNRTISISGLSSGNYNYTYKITNTCAIDIENVEFTIVPNPVLIASNISISSPICVDTDVLISFSNMADGNYTLEYDITGSTNLNNQSANFTIIGGLGNFSINKSSVVNAGSYTIHFLNIGIVGSLCSSSLGNLSSNFTIQGLSNLNNASISVANNCLGANAVVQISNAIEIPDGNYEFNYTLVQSSPISGSSGVVSFLNGIGQFEIPASLLSNIGTYNLSINAIQSVSLVCDHSITNDSTSFEVFPLLNVSGATISAANSCFDFSNEVTIRGANHLIDGTYSLIYELSGVNTSVNTLAVSFINGNSSFSIPSSNLSNPGIVHLSIRQLNLSGNPCGVGGISFNSINFEVFKTSSPQLISNGNEFCNLDEPTIANLSSSISGTEAVFWFDAASGGTAYSVSDLLENNKTYYASFIGLNGCESTSRLEVTVDLTKCTISIPDGFSPNGDGINDQFVIKNLVEVYPNFKLEIYNRYGNLLYKGNQNSPKWDGSTIETGMKVGDSSLAVGVYFYVLEFNDGIRNPKQGRIYLSR